MDENIFDNLHNEARRFSEFERLLNHFVEELIENLSRLTLKHFRDSNPWTISPQIFNNKNNIKEKMQSQEYFKIYGYMICKEIQQIITDLADTDIHQKKALKYSKKEYPVFDEAWVEKKLQGLIKESGSKTALDKEKLRTRIEKEKLQRVHFQEFEIAIHRELKRLVLKHCPHITGISGDGLRQIDYMLQDYMFKISESMRKLLES